MRGKLFLFLVLLILTSFVVSAEHVVINSKDWKDVYSGTLYSVLNNFKVNYLVSETDGVSLVNMKVVDKNEKVLLLSSDSDPLIYGYNNFLNSAGIETEEVSFSRLDSLNLKLAERLVEEKQISTFIVVDSSLGYYSLTLPYYAIQKNAYVLFAEEDNFEEIVEFLEKNALEIIVFGRVDREVKDALKDFNAEFINTGDVYADGIEIAKKSLEEFGNNKQVVLTTGEFIELGLFNSEFPVLLAGTGNLPAVVFDFLKSEDIRSVVVIGSELANSAMRIRETTGANVFIKYGKGINGQLLALDFFPVPSFDPKVRINEVRYNTITKELEVVYENFGDVFSFVQGISHDLLVGEKSLGAVGDEEAFYLDANEIITQTYDIDLLNFVNEEIYAKSNVLLGSSFGSLTKLLTAENLVEIVAFGDDSQIGIESVIFNKRSKRFEVVIKNLGENEVYADVEINNLIIAGEKEIVSGDQSKISRKGTHTFFVKALLEEEDYKENPTIHVKVRYGSRADALIKSLEEEFDLVVKSSNLKWVLVLIVLVILFLLMKKIKEKKRRRVR